MAENTPWLQKYSKTNN